MDENYDIPVERGDLLFTVEMALLKAEGLRPRKYVPGDHDRLKPVARAVVEQLERCGMRCFAKPPPPLHSTPDPWGRCARTSPRAARTMARNERAAPVGSGHAAGRSSRGPA